MKLIAGLGNPGAKYARNRHNIGFMALERIAAAHDFGPWKARHQGSVSEGRFGSDRAILLRPETFMNRSGDSVAAALNFYKLDPSDLIVLHDELDLAPGKVKYKTGGGHAGHNGLRSVHGHLGPEYGRVRLGIGHPGHKDRVADYVLHDFAKSDSDWLEDVLTGLCDGAPWLAAGDSAKFMNAVSLRVAPPRPSTGTRPPQDKAPSGQPSEERPQASDERGPLQKLVDRFR
jgi:PTH1 family peptidyl-tRNA hydrolase